MELISPSTLYLTHVSNVLSNNKSSLKNMFIFVNKFFIKGIACVKSPHSIT
jgi:hypothetical protein